METKSKHPHKAIPSILMFFLFGTCLLPNNVLAKDPARIIAGWVEKVRIEHQDFTVKAKLDTGAKTSSINAINIKSFTKDGDKWVKFTLILTDSENNEHLIAMEKPRSRRTNIKNHDGNHDKRYVVDLEMCFNGHIVPTEFTLADRSEYIYDVLLGRRFLKMFAIVDPKRIFLTSDHCDE